MGTTSALQQSQPKQLHSTEDTSKLFYPKPHYPPPNNQNGRLRQLQLHLLELLLRSGLLHQQQISSSSHRPPCRYHPPPAPQWHSIPSAFIIIVFLKKGKHVNGFLRRVSRGIVDL